jgi:hypothetical protein
VGIARGPCSRDYSARPKFQQLRAGWHCPGALCPVRVSFSGGTGPRGGSAVLCGPTRLRGLCVGSLGITPCPRPYTDMRQAHAHVETPSYLREDFSFRPLTTV